MLLEAEQGFLVVAEAANGVEAVRLARHLKPDILLLDIFMPRREALWVLRKLAASSLDVRKIVLAPRNGRSRIIDGIRLGACGAVTKESAEDSIVTTVRKVMVGECWVEQEFINDLVKAIQKPPRRIRVVSKGRNESYLTGREQEIVEQVMAGRANKDIARELSLNLNTLKHQLTGIFRKLGVSNRAQLISRGP
jgi:DNA-binding NarL/FixJ family response regulator